VTAPGSSVQDSGLNELELGLSPALRDRPYMSVARQKAFGRTGDLLDDEGEGEDDDSLSLLAGLRLWF
jgi:uncharacterized protein involved in copper resistance